MKKQRLLILAGGTGGHIMPALAVAACWQAQGHDVFWIGNEAGLEGQLVKEKKIPFYHLSVAGLRGHSLKRWLSAPVFLSKSISTSYKLLKEIQPDVVLGFGGYVAGPAAVAAFLQKKMLVIHEQNTIPGFTNRLLAKIATHVLETFPGTFSVNAKVRQTGNPVRQEICELASPNCRFMPRMNQPLHLLVLGGSLGARIFNQQVPAAIALLMQKNLAIQVRHQTGKNEIETTRAAYADKKIVADVCPFIENMAEAYAWADLVISRAGATTVCELACAGIGSILVPFPHAVDDHQTTNAQFLEKAKAAILIPQPQLTATLLAEKIHVLMKDRTKLLAMANAAREVACADAAEKIVEICLQQKRMGEII